MMKEYTSEQINNAKEMCQLIQSIPESRRQICVISMMAYIDGIEAGIALERDAKNNEAFRYLKMPV